MIGATGPKVSSATSAAPGGTWSRTAGTSSAPVALAADEQLGPGGDRVAIARLDPDRGRLVDHGADIGRLVGGVSDAQRRRAGGDALDQLVGDLARRR